MMEQSGSTKRSFFSKRLSTEQVKFSRIPRPSDVDLVQRPISSLSKHRIHQLSDIREVSSSSKAASVKKNHSGQLEEMKAIPCTPEAQRNATSGSASSQYATPQVKAQGQKPTGTGLGSRATSAMSLPLRDVPERRSSISMFAHSLNGSRKASIQELRNWQVPPPAERSKTLSLRGRSESPVRQAINRSTQSSEVLRASPSRTFIRTSPPLDVLDKGSIRNERVDLSVHLPSPLFVGGGTVEGHVKIDVREDSHLKRHKPKPISISRLSVDIIGVEGVSDGRRWVFLSLCSELFDDNHPPPPALVESQHARHDSELGWTLKPASAVIPFCINLPLNLGPPPYLSRQASIRYILCPTAHLKVGDKRSLIRQTWNIQMLTVYDPEKALASLPSPLLAADSLIISHTADLQTVKLTAGLHRQTWVNGGKLFIDVHLVNSTPKTIKKLEIQLEKTILWYSHAAAGTTEKSANHLRLPKRSDTEIVSTRSIRRSKDWKGVSGHTSEVRTCELDIPRGHVTISTGRYFEVRFFVNVVASISIFKTCVVQLPVTLIHMNSLDILPNSLAQVAASMEAKRARVLPLNHSQPAHGFHYQGQAFSAPRRQSLDRARESEVMVRNEIGLLTQDLDHSPRRYSNLHTGPPDRPPAVLRNENIPPSHPSNTSSAHHHHKHHPSCYHCHLLYANDGERPGTAVSNRSQAALKLPRLQVSTSGLGFSESEFEIPADSPPRKVMLSEQERKMINQQTELRMQRQWSQNNHKRSVAQVRGGRIPGNNVPLTWKNVAAVPGAHPRQPAFGNLSELNHKNHPSSKIPRRADSGKGKEAVRPRSRTNPERAPSRSGTRKHRQGRRSIESTKKDVAEVERGILGIARGDNGVIGSKGTTDKVF